MRRPWSALAEALALHERAALATVVRMEGSAPREPGARMVARPDGSFGGTIGGGALEWQVLAWAQAALADAAAPPFDLRSFALGPELGQCCGGRVEVAVEVFDRSRLGEVAAFAAREAAGGAFTTRGQVGAGGRLLREVAAEGAADGPAILRDGEVLIERFGDRVRPLLLFGAGHVGRALVLALAPLPFAVTWIDSRADGFPARYPATVRTVRSDDPRTALADAPEGAFVLVMTHSHALDLAIVHAALAAGRFPHVGLIGSATKRARFEKQMAAAGLAPSRIAELVCPIGIGGITSKQPAVIAAATVADLLIRDEALRLADQPAVTRLRAGRGR